MFDAMQIQIDNMMIQAEQARLFQEQQQLVERQMLDQEQAYMAQDRQQHTQMLFQCIFDG